MTGNYDIILDSQVLKDAIQNHIKNNGIFLSQALQRTGMNKVRTSRISDWLNNKDEDHDNPITHRDVVDFCDYLGVEFKIRVELGKLKDKKKEDRKKARPPMDLNKLKRLDDVNKVTEDYIDE